MPYLIQRLVKYLKRTIVVLEKRFPQDKSEDTTLLNSLAPRILTDEKELKRIDPYITRLKRALDTEDINNIALTGNYGSGKSTMLKTFRYLYPDEYKYLNISLASFKDNKENFEDNNDTKDENAKVEEKALERKLEVSILQQIFYHVKPSKIPDLRFKRIVNIPPWKMRLLAGQLIIWLLSALILFKFNKIDKLNPEGWSIDYSLGWLNLLSTVDWIALLSTVIFLLGVGFFAKNILRLFSNSKISKFNIKGEIELGGSTDKSVFNQHLEEILYFFERTDYDVVIIEDIDRFKSTDIFTKLREINILLNNSNLIKRRVKFVYAIIDEMFNDKNERVKFFEFIIPVIPFINPSNANDQLVKLLRVAELENVLSSDFKSDVVTFIDDIDMRLLINIFHEFLVYRESLSQELTQDNLFAIIVYKNMFPDDFGELAKRKGKLYNFLSNRSLFVKELEDKVEEKIDTIDKDIAELESEIDKPIEELRAVYINRLISKLGDFHSFSINSSQVSSVEVLSDDNFEVIKNQDKIIYKPYSSGYETKSKISFSSVEKEVSDLNYDQREKLLIDRSNNKINSLKSERESLKSRIQEIESLSIKEIFEQVDIEEYLGEFKENDLMRNLLLNGYINEHYDDYISLFHEVSLTKEDFAFERKVKSGKNSEFDYSLSKIETLLKRLPNKYFKREVILNYDLLEYLIENKSTYYTKYDNFFKGLGTDGERQFQFINGLIKRDSKNLNLFIKEICIYKLTIWQYLKNKSGLPEEGIRKFLKLIFEHANKEYILELHEIETLVSYLEQIDDFFAFSSDLEDITSIRHFLYEKGVRLERLDEPSSLRVDLLDYIYEKNLYRINEHNISILANYYGKSIDQEKFNKAHYSTLLNSGLDNLLSYISDNIEEYIEDVMLKVEGNVSESEETIIGILNRSDVNEKLKRKVVENQSTIINSISEVDYSDARQTLLNNDKIKPTWDNVFDYFDGIEADELDQSLTNFLNREENYILLSKRKLDDDRGRDKDYIEKVSKLILHCNEIDINAYSSLLNSIPFEYDSIDYQKVNTNQIEAMLSENMLALSNDNFGGLKGKENNLHIKLIEKHQGEFVNNFNEFSLEENDWNLFFKSSSISIDNKLTALQNIDDSVIVDSRQVANTICDILPPDKYIPLSFEVLDAMFKAHYSVQKRIAILILHFEHLNNSQIQSLVEILGDNYTKLFKKQNKPTFANNPYHNTLFEKLKKRNLISSYKEIEKGNEIRVHAKY